MKTNLKLAVALAAITILAGAASAVMAQPKVGGYKVIPNTDAAAKEAANFAIGDKNAHGYSSFKLKEILKAERQIVAGSNYKICLSADDLGTGDSGTYQAVVYVNLKRESKLVSWAKAECGAAPAPTTPARPPIVGGFKPVETTDEHARAAAEWAVREKGEKTEKGIELLTLVKAEQQVVQGMNYRLCMKINTEGEDEPVSFVEAVVYMDLKMNYKLSSWKAASKCGDTKE
jgi:hypothetical protein